MNCLPNHLDLRLIHPKRGDQFSPNLLRLLIRKPSLGTYAHVFQHDDEKTLWLGFTLDGDFIGCRLIHALCAGGRAEVGCYPHRDFVAKLTCVPDFWPKYLQVGRCALDPDHTEHFISKSDRFEILDDGNRRRCLWCGLEQIKHTWTETINRSAWIKPNS